ncbi:hypothetical protein MRX96_003256 [Rhipicephalus microplus]
MVSANTNSDEEESVHRTLIRALALDKCPRSAAHTDLKAAVAPGLPTSFPFCESGAMDIVPWAADHRRPVILLRSAFPATSGLNFHWKSIRLCTAARDNATYVDNGLGEQLPPSPLCPWRRSRHLRRDPASHRWFRPAPVLAPLVPPRVIQPKQSQILPKLSSGSANMTTPSAAATTRSQSPRAAQHKATPRPTPVLAPLPATTVQRGAAMGLNTGSPLLTGNPAAAQPGMFSAGPAQGTFLLNQYIPGLGHSPILIQGASGQTQSSLGTDTEGPAGPAATPCYGPDPGTSDGAQAPWGTSRTAWHPDACHPTEPGAKAQHLSGTATHDVTPLVCHSPGTATDAATAAGHAAHADHAGPAHTGGQRYTGETGMAGYSIVT